MSRKRSKLEAQFGRWLRECGLDVRAQTKVGPFTVDYTVNGPSRPSRIAIEIDGCYFHACKTCHPRGDAGEAIRKRDGKREVYLRSKGWFVFRVREHDINKHGYRYAFSVAQQILRRRTP